MTDWPPTDPEEGPQGARGRDKNDNAVRSSNRECTCRSGVVNRKCKDTCSRRKWLTRRCSRRVCAGTMCMEELTRRKRRPTLHLRVSQESIHNSWQLLTRIDTTLSKDDGTTGESPKKFDGDETEFAGLVQGEESRLLEGGVKREVESDEEVVTASDFVKKEIKTEEIELEDEATLGSRVEDKSTQRDNSASEELLREEDIADKWNDASNGINGDRLKKKRVCANNSYTCKSRYSWIIENDESPVIDRANGSTLYHESREKYFSSAQGPCRTKCPRRPCFRPAMAGRKCVRMNLTPSVHDVTLKKFEERASTKEIQETEDGYRTGTVFRGSFGRQIDIDTYRKPRWTSPCSRPSRLFYRNCYSTEAQRRAFLDKYYNGQPCTQGNNCYRPGTAESTSSTDTTVDNRKNAEDTTSFPKDQFATERFANVAQCYCRHKSTIPAESSGWKKIRRSSSNLSLSGRCFYRGRCRGPCKTFCSHLNRTVPATCTNTCSAAVLVEKLKRRCPRHGKRTNSFSSGSSTSSFSSTSLSTYCKSRRSNRTTCSSD